MVVQFQFQTYYALLLTINLTLTLIVALAACLCCKRKVPKNELLGLEGMVKLKNPDDIIVVAAVGNSESQADLNLSTISTADSEKRASTAAHRSLPDIPVAEINGDNGSELYETVADKRLMDTQNNRDKSPIASLKKQTSVSQHSSISQADDVSSPYSRVKNSPHNYAKVRSTEHPYAQLNAPSTSTAATSTSGITGSTSSQLQLNNNNDLLNRNSYHSSASTQNLNNSVPLQAEIPAASAIAGMISASQDLPYMTPPISNQHFSGDSQDSSKGYTSISVREPLANILAQQPASKPVQRHKALSRDANDSHYATVSDDSDETYAAIEDPNARQNSHAAVDIYTSGSETYAQIQPMQTNSIVVAVEINNTSSSAYNTASIVVGSLHHQQQPPQMEHNINQAPSHNRVTNSEHSIPTPVDSLRAQMQQHSRQASSSSNNSSSMGNLGSPKPEKRQANSPLPPTPTPKTNSTSSSSNLTSGRNSVISVIECGESVVLALPGDPSSSAPAETSPQKKNKSLSPSKDIEGMYAKVMKKNKFSRHASSSSSQNNSPIMTRKHSTHGAPPILLSGVSTLDGAAAELVGVDKSRVRSNSYSAKDHGYETIPADATRSGGAIIENRKSDCYANILQKERQQEGVPLPPFHATNYTNVIPPIDVASHRITNKHYETISNMRSTQNNDPGYEKLLNNPKSKQSEPDKEIKSSDYDPNYEMVKHAKYSTPAKVSKLNNSGLSDDGYAKVIDKKRQSVLDDEDATDGYSKVRGDNDLRTNIAGYSTIGEAKSVVVVTTIECNNIGTTSTDSNHNYASILETKMEIHDTDSDSDYARIAERRINEMPLLVTTPTTTDELYSTRLPEALPSIASPSASINSSSLLHNSSTASTSTNLTSSSLQTPTFSSSQYESLTGSDTDPNYESVCYLNTTNTTTTTTATTPSEHPYERLQAENSDTQLNSPLTPDERTHQVHTKSMINGPAKILHSAESNTDAIVDDYFQV